MFEITIPFPIKGVPLKPELMGSVKLDETAIQTLAALLGWDGEGRRLLNCSVGGSLNTVSPPIEGIKVSTAGSTPDDFTFGDIPTTEILLQSYNNNIGNVFVNVDSVATQWTCWHMGAGSILKISINNLSRLHIRIMKEFDSVNFFYTR